MSAEGVGQYIKAGRVAAGMTMIALGKAMGVSPVFVANMEGGAKRVPDARVKSLAAAVPGLDIARIRELNPRPRRGPQVLARIIDQLIEDYGDKHVSSHGVEATLRQLREDANTAAEGLKSMRAKAEGWRVERDAARASVCVSLAKAEGRDPGLQGVREAAVSLGWGYLYPEEVEL